MRAYLVFHSEAFIRTRTNSRASQTKLRTRNCPNFPKLPYAFAKKVPYQIRHYDLYTCEIYLVVRQILSGYVC